MAKRVQSEAEKEYKRERQKLLNVIQQQEQVGFIFPEDIVPEIPKHITHKDAEEIKKIRTKSLYDSAKFLDKSTGEIIDVITRTPISKSTQTNVSKQSKQVQKSAPNISISVSKISEPKESKVKQPKEPKVKQPKEPKVKQPKEPKVKHTDRSSAAKKAWETRRSKMTNEEYEQYKKDFTERMRKAREAKKTGEPYYPTISPIDKVQEKLEELVHYYNLEELQSRLPTLERRSYAIFPIEARKNTLISIFEDTIMRNEDNLQALEDYLNQHSEEINDLLDRIEYDSDQDGTKTERSFVRLGSILNQGSLSGFQAEDFSWYSEIANNYEEIE